MMDLEPTRPRTRLQLRNLARDFATEAKPYVEGLGDAHPFIARLLRTLEWRPDDLKTFILRKHDQFEASFLSPECAAPAHGDSHIDKLTHKIWLTSAQEAFQPPIEYLTAYLAMCRGQPADWTHFFWSNNADVLLAVSKLARESGAKINVLDTHSLPDSSLISTVERLIADRKYVLAADVMKFMVLDRYGGIYSDLGILYDNEMLHMAAAADYSFLLASNVFFQTSWISLAKGSLLSTAFLGILNNPEVLSAEYALDQSRTVSAGTEVHTFAGLGYTLCALLFMPSSSKMFAFPQSTLHLRWNSQQSWYGTVSKHGNVLINEVLPSVIQEQRYAHFALEASKRLRTFNANGRLTEFARIVVRLFDYFMLNETSLAKRLSFDNSDKVGGWHNYGYLYTFLLGVFSKSSCSLLEVGDSSSLWGNPANPGHGRGVEGGSIRFWREYLNAATTGVEITRSDIREFDIAQLVSVNGSPQAFDAAIESWQGDIFIDNGFHYFEATVGLLEKAMPRLKESGVYVIEAVSLSDIERWEAYLNAHSLTGFLVFFPHASNRFDNCIIVLFNTRRTDGLDPSLHIYSHPTWIPGPTETLLRNKAERPRVTYGDNLQRSRNVFRDAYSSATDEQWKTIWLSTESDTSISGIEFPALPDAELQLQIHGSSSWEISMTEAFDFYRFIKSTIGPIADSARFLDYGCGWGRMLRPFLRDFDLNHMFGFEPNLKLAATARNLNPYVCVLSGDYVPDGSIPRDWFDVIVGWSVFSHLSKRTCESWLEEIGKVLKPGGTAVFTTWGLRFLRRLQAEEENIRLGNEVHWYSRMCIDTAGDLSERIARFEAGEFVWFTNTDSESYGEAFLGETALSRIIEAGKLPLQIVAFDTTSLYQDVFVLRRDHE